MEEFARGSAVAPALVACLAASAPPTSATAIPAFATETSGEAGPQDWNTSLCRAFAQPCG